MKGYDIIPGIEGMDDVDTDGNIKAISIKLGADSDVGEKLLDQAMSDKDSTGLKEAGAIEELAKEPGTESAEETPCSSGCEKTDGLMAAILQLGLSPKDAIDMLQKASGETPAESAAKEESAPKTDSGSEPKGKATPTEIPADKKPSDGPSKDDIKPSGNA